MGKNKLKKFADMDRFECALQYPREQLLAGGFPYRGEWNGKVFAADRPITLELGCGRGEYTVALARRYPDRNFIGIDIKGARLWAGARTVEEEKIGNARFLRTEIENITSFFAPGEVDELWITFPDPQMQKRRKRLVSARFLGLYNRLLRLDGIINLKTDSPFLYEFARRLVKVNDLPVLTDCPDIYGRGFRDTDDLYGSDFDDAATSVKTYYEEQWLSRGKTIKLLRFRLPADARELTDPDDSDIPRDDYRSTKGR